MQISSGLMMGDAGDFPLGVHDTRDSYLLFFSFFFGHVPHGPLSFPIPQHHAFTPF
jgi:hypothetical protein